MMGICIIWIMLFHSTISAPDSNILRLIWYLCISFGGGFGVNIFLILSGFGLTYSRLKKENEGTFEKWIDFYKRRFLKIIPTYLIIASLFYAISYSSITQFIYNLSFLNFILEGIRDFWYILLILICYLSFPIFLELTRKMNFRIVLASIILLGFIFTLFLMYYFPKQYNNWEIALWRFPCFWMGVYYGYLIFENNSKEFLISTGLFTLFGIFLFVFFGFIRNTFLFLSPLVMLIFCFILEIKGFLMNYLKKIFLYFGNISLELYLVHVSLGTILANYIYNCVKLECIKIIVYFGGSIIIALIFYYLIRKEVY